MSLLLTTSKPDSTSVHHAGDVLSVEKQPSPAIFSNSESDSTGGRILPLLRTDQTTMLSICSLHIEDQLFKVNQQPCTSSLASPPVVSSSSASKLTSKNSSLASDTLPFNLGTGSERNDDEQNSNVNFLALPTVLDVAGEEEGDDAAESPKTIASTTSSSSRHSGASGMLSAARRKRNDASKIQQCQADVVLPDEDEAAEPIYGSSTSQVEADDPDYNTKQKTVVRKGGRRKLPSEKQRRLSGASKKKNARQKQGQDVETESSDITSNNSPEQVRKTGRRRIIKKRHSQDESPPEQAKRSRSTKSTVRGFSERLYPTSRIISQDEKVLIRTFISDNPTEPPMVVARAFNIGRKQAWHMISRVLPERPPLRHRVSEDDVQRVSDIINNSPHLSYNNMAKELCMAKSTFQHIAREKLRKRSRKGRSKNGSTDDSELAKFSDSTDEADAKYEAETVEMTDAAESSVIITKQESIPSDSNDFASVTTASMSPRKTRCAKRRFTTPLDGEVEAEKPKRRGRKPKGGGSVLLSTSAGNCLESDFDTDENLAATKQPRSKQGAVNSEQPERVEETGTQATKQEKPDDTLSAGMSTSDLHVTQNELILQQQSQTIQQIIPVYPQQSVAQPGQWVVQSGPSQYHYHHPYASYGAAQPMIKQEYMPEYVLADYGLAASPVPQARYIAPYAVSSPQPPQIYAGNYGQQTTVQMPYALHHPHHAHQPLHGVHHIMPHHGNFVAATTQPPTTSGGFIVSDRPLVAVSAHGVAGRHVYMVADSLPTSGPVAVVSSLSPLASADGVSSSSRTGNTPGLAVNNNNSHNNNGAAAEINGDAVQEANGNNDQQRRKSGASGGATSHNNSDLHAHIMLPKIEPMYETAFMSNGYTSTGVNEMWPLAYHNNYNNNRQQQQQHQQIQQPSYYPAPLMPVHHHHHPQRIPVFHVQHHSGGSFVAQQPPPLLPASRPINWNYVPVSSSAVLFAANSPAGAVSTTTLHANGGTTPVSPRFEISNGNRSSATRTAGMQTGGEAGDQYEPASTGGSSAPPMNGQRAIAQPSGVLMPSAAGSVMISHQQHKQIVYEDQQF